MLHVIVTVQSLVVVLAARRRDERGQASAEYALVLLGAALVAGLVIRWVTSSGRVTQLLEAVMSRVTSLAR